MSKIISATYEKGVIKPKQPLKLSDHQEIKLVIISPDIFDEAKKAVFDFDIEDEVNKADVLAWK